METVMLKRSALAALVLAGFASGALAQTQSSRSQSPPQRTEISPGAARYENVSNQAKLWRQSMTDTPQPEVTQDQRRRAQKAVALIKANRCEDAYNLALAEQDYQLALNIAGTCKAHFRQ